MIINDDNKRKNINNDNDKFIYVIIVTQFHTYNHAQEFIFRKMAGQGFGFIYYIMNFYDNV